MSTIFSNDVFATKEECNGSNELNASLMSEKGIEDLLELENGMQSKDTEIRVQSFLRFVNFFEEYPEPLLVNNGQKVLRASYAF